MSIVPRIHDAVEVRAVPELDDGTRYLVIDNQGTERMRLDEAGRFLFLQLDGLRTVDEVRHAFRDRFGRELSEGGLGLVVERLGEAGLLVADSRGLRALRRLRAKGVRYRGMERDRRRRQRPDDRRDADAFSTLFFDEAIFLINEGRLEAALEVFQRLANKPALEVRVQTIISHLKFVQVSESAEEVGLTEKETNWPAFDRALSAALSAGTCPKCHADFVVELGAINICELCGASFSHCVVQLATTPSRRA